MTIRDFLKPKNFNIKAKSLSFESVQYMTDLDKKKIYINFVKFLNNHFKRTLFKKNLYEHFHCHCGFIAHYNILMGSMENILRLLPIFILMLMVIQIQCTSVEEI